MKFMKWYILVGIGGMVLGLGTAWSMFDTPQDVLSDDQYKHLRKQVEDYHRVPELPSIQTSWKKLQRYVNVYPDVKLLKTGRDVLPPSSILTGQRGALLSGDLLQVFSILKNIQTIIPVYFHRMSIQFNAEQSLAKLNLYVLGQDSIANSINPEEEL